MPPPRLLPPTGAPPVPPPMPLPPGARPPIPSAGGAPQPMAATISAAPAIIAAQPQLRDLKSESTKLVPAQLLRPRSTITKAAPARPVVPSRPTPAAQMAKSTDEAYDEFMKEMGGLI